MTHLPKMPSWPGVIWRPATSDDASRIVELQDACFEVDDTYREVESEIKERFTDPEINPSTDSMLGVLEDGRIISSTWAYIASSAETKWRAFAELHVHPDWRDRGLGPALEWWEARTLQRLAEKDDDLPRGFWLGAYIQEEQWISLLQGRGYEIQRYYDELVLDLADGVPSASFPDGISVVPAEDAAEGDELRVHNDSFRDHWGSQPFTQERWDHFKNEFYMPDASFVAYEGDAPIGHILCTKYPHDFDDRGFTHAWIESLGVVRSHRKRGIASALIARSLGVFVDQGLQKAVLGVDSENPSGAYGLYEALGFKPDRRNMALVKAAG